MERISVAKKSEKILDSTKWHWLNWNQFLVIFGNGRHLPSPRAQTFLCHSGNYMTLLTEDRGGKNQREIHSADGGKHGRVAENLTSRKPGGTPVCLHGALSEAECACYHLKDNAIKYKINTIHCQHVKKHRWKKYPPKEKK